MLESGSPPGSTSKRASGRRSSIGPTGFSHYAALVNANNTGSTPRKGQQQDFGAKLRRAAITGLDAPHFKQLLKAACAAFEGQRVELLQMLNAQDEHGATALHCAAYRRKPYMIKELMKAGAEPNIKDEDGSTPLHLVLAHGDTDRAGVLQCLLELLTIQIKNGHKAVVDAYDKAGLTPLMYAVRADLAEAVVLLVEHGADLTAKCKAAQDNSTVPDKLKSLTAVQMAIAEDRGQVLDALLHKAMSDDPHGQLESNVSKKQAIESQIPQEDLIRAVEHRMPAWLVSNNFCDKELRQHYGQQIPALLKASKKDGSPQPAADVPAAAAARGTQPTETADKSQRKKKDNSRKRKSRDSVTAAGGPAKGSPVEEDPSPKQQQQQQEGEGAPLVKRPCISPIADQHVGQQDQEQQDADELLSPTAVWQTPAAADPTTVAAAAAAAAGADTRVPAAAIAAELDLIAATSNKPVTPGPSNYAVVVTPGPSGAAMTPGPSQSGGVTGPGVTPGPDSKSLKTPPGGDAGPAGSQKTPPVTPGVGSLMFSPKASGPTPLSSFKGPSPTTSSRKAAAAAALSGGKLSRQSARLAAAMGMGGISCLDLKPQCTAAGTAAAAAAGGCSGDSLATAAMSGGMQRAGSAKMHVQRTPGANVPTPQGSAGYTPQIAGLAVGGPATAAAVAALGGSTGFKLSRQAARLLGAAPGASGGGRGKQQQQQGSKQELLQPLMPDAAAPAAAVVGSVAAPASQETAEQAPAAAADGLHTIAAAVPAARQEIAAAEGPAAAAVGTDETGSDDKEPMQVPLSAAATAESEDLVDQLLAAAVSAAATSQPGGLVEPAATVSAAAEGQVDALLGAYAPRAVPAAGEQLEARVQQLDGLRGQTETHLAAPPAADQSAQDSDEHNLQQQIARADAMSIAAAAGPAAEAVPAGDAQGQQTVQPEGCTEQTAAANDADSNDQAAAMDVDEHDLAALLPPPAAPAAADTEQEQAAATSAATGEAVGQQQKQQEVVLAAAADRTGVDGDGLQADESRRDSLAAAAGEVMLPGSSDGRQQQQQQSLHTGALINPEGSAAKASRARAAAVAGITAEQQQHVVDEPEADKENHQQPKQKRHKSASKADVVASLNSAAQKVLSSKQTEVADQQQQQQKPIGRAIERYTEPSRVEKDLGMELAATSEQQQQQPAAQPQHTRRQLQLGSQQQLGDLSAQQQQQQEGQQSADGGLPAATEFQFAVLQHKAIKLLLAKSQDQQQHQQQQSSPDNCKLLDLSVRMFKYLSRAVAALPPVAGAAAAADPQVELDSAEIAGQLRAVWDIVQSQPGDASSSAVEKLASLGESTAAIARQLLPTHDKQQQQPEEYGSQLEVARAALHVLARIVSHLLNVLTGHVNLHNQQYQCMLLQRGSDLATLAQLLQDAVSAAAAEAIEETVLLVLACTCSAVASGSTTSTQLQLAEQTSADTNAGSTGTKLLWVQLLGKAGQLCTASHSSTLFSVKELGMAIDMVESCRDAYAAAMQETRGGNDSSNSDEKLILPLLQITNWAMQDSKQRNLTAAAAASSSSSSSSSSVAPVVQELSGFVKVVGRVLDMCSDYSSSKLQDLQLEVIESLNDIRECLLAA